MAKFGIDSGDEWNLQASAYHIQQAIEKVIKQTLSDYGIDYRKTHNIENLLNNLPSDQTVFSEELLSRLYDVADTLTMWEHLCRYADPYMASYRKVSSLYEIACKVLEAYTTNCRSKQNDAITRGSSGYATVKQMNLFDK